MRMTKLNIFEYHHPREFLTDCFAELKGTQSNYSLRRWSEDLGFKNPGHLSNVLNGKYKVTKKFINRVSGYLDLNVQEYLYFEAMSDLHYADCIEDKELQIKKIETLTKRSPKEKFDIDAFRLIKEWYHVPIMEMTRLKSFKLDYKQIAKRLGNQVSTQAVELAVDRLIRVGLLAYNKTGQLKRTSKDFQVGYEIPSEAIQYCHKQILQNAISKIDTLIPSRRDFSSMQITINENNLGKLKSHIREFQQKIMNLAEDESADYLYQINLQAFNLLSDD